MTEIFCVTGFLGAGKTTLLNKILPLCLTRSKVAVIENDFGDTGIDAGLVAETGAQVRELAAGCICCSLRGEMKSALLELITTEKPDLVFIEPSGISRSSDILCTLEALEVEGILKIGNIVNLVEAGNFEDYLDTFGDFFGDQISSARAILFSHQHALTRQRLDSLTARVRDMNQRAAFLVSDWLDLEPEALWDFIRDSSGVISEEDAARCNAGRPGADVFYSWSGRPGNVFSRGEIESVLAALDAGVGGIILRAKGFVRSADGAGWHFDYLKGHREIKPAASFSEARVLVIGQDLQVDQLTEQFRI